MTRAPLHLLGAGRAATALGRLLYQAGHPIGAVVTTRLESAARAVAIVGAGAPGVDPEAALTPGGITLLGVPDAALSQVAARLGRETRACPGAVALHLSGTCSSEVLAPLRPRSVAVGSLHPLHAFADREHPPATLRGVTLGVEGDARARAVAAELVAALQARALPVRSDTKALYHAGAALASNALVTLFHCARRLEIAAGAPAGEAAAALLSLMQGTLENVAALGTPGALTGPIERGDREVVAAHRDAVATHAPELLEVYLALARATVDVAVEKGKLDAGGRAALLALLRAPGP